ncbi:BURP domain-containing protein 3 [Platanthera guangdongensis]|uniref:BURP domain-containing protein 3 n=1 Tax=Platanthera guangdongensis TaxID=2320717 RepID=A0ABR2M0N4_9ASPA
MGLLLPLLSAVLMFLVVVVGANHAALSEPVAYWHEILPRTPIPTAIAKHLPNVHADDKTATSVNVGKGGVNVNTGKGTTVGVGKGGVDVHTGKGTSVTVGKGGVGVVTGKSKPGGTTVGVGKGGVNVHTGKGTSVNVGKGGVGVATQPKGKPVVVHVNPIGSPFNYIYAASDTQLNTDPAAALFFLPNDLRPGKQFTLQLAANDVVPAATFITRPAAEAIPFSVSELPSILPRFNIPSGSGEAEAMRSTLLECEAVPAAGEKKRCATSLESMVDFATGSLATRDVVAVGTEGGGAASTERRPYKVKAVRKAAAAGGKGVVACHPEAYPYAVFLCHATTAAEVYEVELAEDGGMATVKAVAVCHTDTARWNPKHLAFRVLKVKPGKVAVCHFLPRDHVVWAAKV